MAKPITQICKANCKAWDALSVVVLVDVVFIIVVVVAVVDAATQIFAINIFVR